MIKMSLQDQLIQQVKQLDKKQAEELQFYLREITQQNTDEYSPQNFLYLQKLTSLCLRDFYTLDQQLRPNIRAEKKHVSLPREFTETNNSFPNIIERRRSRREYQTQPISLPQLSELLYYTYGATGKISLRGYRNYILRSAPSAGALYPINLSVIVNSVDTLSPGFYRYKVKEHALESIFLGDIRSPLVQAGLGQQFMATAAVVLVLSAVLERIIPRYGIRGYRYIYLDAGHIAQNAYLAAEYLNLGACDIGAFYDDAVHSVLGFDPEKEFVVLMITIGRV